MKKYFYLFIPLITVVLCSLLAFTSLDNKIADLFQRCLKPTKQSESVIMINIDDIAVEEIGSWPFSRDVYSNALITLKELGAEAAVFDLSFIDKSQSKVDKDYVQYDLPSYVDQNFSEIDDSVLQILGGFQDGSFSPSDANDLAEYYLSTAEASKNRIKTNISYAIKDTDGILANNLKFFDNSFLTLTFNDDAQIEKDMEEYLSTYIALDNISVAKNAKIPSYKGVSPAIKEFLVKCKKAGFVNADADDDGYLRRLFMVMEYNGKYYGQLLFVPILEHFGNPEIEVSKHLITLKDCKLDNGTVKDLKIPLDKNGSVIIKYPPISFYDYNNISFKNIYRISVLEEDFISALNLLQDNGFFSIWEEENPITMYTNANYVREQLYEGDNEEYTYELYSQFKEEFYRLSAKFLDGSIQNQFDSLYSDDPDTRAYIDDCFDKTVGKFNNLLGLRNAVKNKVQNAFCIFGTCATSTTDFGLIQYEEKYPNPGVHYTVANQLLSQDFVDDSPVWISIVIAVILCFGYVLLSKRIKSTGHQMIFGLVLVVLSTLLLLLFFILTKTYIGTAIPVISLVICFVAQTVINLILTSRDKKFIQGAFSQCLSPDVVGQLVAHPESFKLGGSTYQMSAIFTDIQKFSAFSELLTAEQLVALLNYYLTMMSDIIMGERGTVDKYEGDAIIALVGAPLQMDDHADRACAAAIKMKVAEEESNKRILQIVDTGDMPELLEDPVQNATLFEAFKIMVNNHRVIFTRIGINSGDIVAGYMGSDKKKNYTMMGNNVNLASRLEGVNKQYRTGGILISEATRLELSEDFLVRSLDRVQVVNVTTPIRLYEVLGFKSQSSETQLKYVEYWETNMALFEKGDYQAALEGFKKLFQTKESDNVAKYYIELIEKFFIKGSYPTVGDDFGVAYNTENPEGMNPDWVGTKYEIKGTFKLLQK